MDTGVATVDTGVATEMLHISVCSPKVILLLGAVGCSDGVLGVVVVGVVTTVVGGLVVGTVVGVVASVTTLVSLFSMNGQLLPAANNSSTLSTSEKR